MNDLRTRLLAKFRDPEYRHEYLDSFLDSLVTGQIRELRESRGWSQEDLAKKLRTTQSAISRLESPSYFKWKIDTLKKLARAFDVAFVGKFVSFGDALDDIEDFGLDKLIRPDFSRDPVFNEQAPDHHLESDTRASRANTVVAFGRPEKQLRIRQVSSSSPSTPTAEYEVASSG